MTKKLVLLAAALTLTAWTSPVTAASPQNADDEVTSEATPALQEVDAIKVCMVNDQLFAKDQIPVEVEGKTYFGCCEMCKARLAERRGHSPCRRSTYRCNRRQGNGRQSSRCQWSDLLLRRLRELRQLPRGSDAKSFRTLSRDRMGHATLPRGLRTWLVRNTPHSGISKGSWSKD